MKEKSKNVYCLTVYHNGIIKISYIYSYKKPAEKYKKELEEQYKNDTAYKIIMTSKSGFKSILD